MSRKLIIALIFTDTIYKLDDTIKRRDYVQVELRKVHKKNILVGRSKPKELIDAFKIANKAWISAQEKYLGNGLEYSVPLTIQFFIAKEPWLVKYFGLNLKHFDRLYNSYDLSKHIFRSAKITNTILEEVDDAIRD